MHRLCDRPGHVLAAILPGLVSVTGLLTCYQLVYGEINAGAVSTMPGNFSYVGALSLKRSATYLLAMFLDSKGGVFAYGPILMLALGIVLGLLMVLRPESMYSVHRPGFVPAIAESYPAARLDWIFPSYDDGGPRAAALTLLWVGVMGWMSWPALRPSRAPESAPVAQSEARRPDLG